MQHHFILELSHVRLRPVGPLDLELIRNWRNQDHIRRFFLQQEIIESSQQLLWFHEYLKKNDDLMFIIEETEELKRSVGTVALYDIDLKALEAEFGRFMLGDMQARGRGIGQNVLKQISEFGFTEFGLNRINLEVLADNKKAIKLYEKCGFCTVSQSYRNGKSLIQMKLDKV